MKKRILSLALALALCLGLAAPAMAAEWLYDFKVGAADDPEPIPSGTVLSLRNWNFAEQQNPTTNAYEYSYTLGEITNYSLEPGSFYLPLNEEITIRKIDGSMLDDIYLTAWSDPDGDGVYVQRLAMNVADMNTGNILAQLLPVNTASPIRSNEVELPLLEENKYVENFTGSWMFSDSNEVDFCGQVWYELNELKISTTYLAQLFGKNTLLHLSFPAGDDEFFFNFLVTDVPEETSLVDPVAYASTQSVLVDGSPVEFQAYALKDANGNDTNYIKLRDVASVLNGTAVQFNVGWDGAVNIETGKGYAPNGSEMKTPFSGNRAYENATAETRINGSRAALDAIVLKDDNGGAYTYYKLRDLGAALGFRVDWSAEKGIFIETK